MSLKQKFLTIITLSVTALNAGCSPVSQTAIESTTTAFDVISTETPSLNPTPTNTPSVIIPTLSAEESKASALNLLKNNGNCRLPCIWGLTPGITTTNDRQTILASYSKHSEANFSISASEASKNPGSFGIGITKDNVRISVGLSYYENENLIEILSLVTILEQDNKYIFGNINYSNLLEYYTLPRLLSIYGLPSEVLVFAYPHDPFLKADYEPFSLVVIYSDLGIMAEYISPTEWIGKMVEILTPGLWVGEIARGCPSQSLLTLRTWDVKKNIPMKKVASIAAGDGISESAYDHFVSIRDATSISIIDFYNTFKIANNNQCIDLPSKLWIP